MYSSRCAWIAVLLFARSAAADDSVTALRPVVSHHGWQLDLTGYVQVDAVAHDQQSVDEVDSTNQPLNQAHFGIPRASLRVDAHRGSMTGELELEGFTTRATLPRVTQESGVRLETAQLGWHHR